MLLVLLLVLVGLAAGAPPQQQQQEGLAPPGYGEPAQQRRMPILYEAYYPEPREWSPQASLQEIAKLRELTSQLLREEEQLSQMAAAAADATPENVFEPRSQILEYVFSRPANPPPKNIIPLIRAEPAMINDDVQVTSLTVSDVGRGPGQPQHRTRHHHGQADWLLRRLAANNAR